jgi:hypothetical protein
MNNFSITCQFTLKEYRKIYYRLLYGKIGMIILSIFSVLYLIGSCILWFTHNNVILNSDYYLFATMIGVLGIWIPLFSLYTIYRNFKTAYRLNELITYNFSDEGYTSTGESFNSTVNWEKVYKVKVIKGWLILYHSRMLANIIKTERVDEEHIESLKKFLQAGNFKAKLRW